MEKVKLNCECGNLTTLLICSANSTGSMHSGLLAAQIRDLNNGNSSSISLNINGKKPGKVDCNEECAKLERNRRVALALQIEQI
jgi:transcriptional repressor NF-X1